MKRLNLLATASALFISFSALAAAPTPYCDTGKTASCQNTNNQPLCSGATPSQTLKAACPTGYTASCVKDAQNPVYGSPACVASSAGNSTTMSPTPVGGIYGEVTPKTTTTMTPTEVGGIYGSVDGGTLPATNTSKPAIPTIQKPTCPNGSHNTTCNNQKHKGYAMCSLQKNAPNAMCGSQKAICDAQNKPTCPTP